MPYLIVRESYVTDSCLVDGLPLHEIRQVMDRSAASSELKDEKNRRVEFHTEAIDLLSALEHIGYKVAGGIRTRILNTKRRSCDEK